MKKKLLSLLLCLCMVLSLLPTVVLPARAATADFAGGNGTLEDPYRIATVTQLKKMADTTAEAKDNPRYYKLMNDLANVGATGIDTFSGYFSGEGHTISGLVGRLVYTNNGTIRNVKLASPTFPKLGNHPAATKMGSDGDYERMITGYYNNEPIYAFTGSARVVSTYYTYADVGFAAGINSGTIDNVTVTGGTIEGYYDDSSINGYGTDLYRGMIEYAPSRIGGITGYNAGRVRNCTVKDLTIHSDITLGSTGGITGYTSGEAGSTGGLQGCVVDGFKIEVVKTRDWSNTTGGKTYKFLPWAVGGIVGNVYAYRNSYMTPAAVYQVGGTTQDQTLNPKGWQRDYINTQAENIYQGVTASGDAASFPLDAWNTNAANQTAYPGLKARTDIYTVNDTLLPTGQVEVRTFDDTGKLIKTETVQQNGTSNYTLPVVSQTKYALNTTTTNNEYYDVYMNRYRVTNAVDGSTVLAAGKAGDKVSMAQSVNVYYAMPVTPYLTCSTATQTGQSFILKLIGWRANPAEGSTLTNLSALYTAAELKALTDKLTVTYRKQGSSTDMTAVPTGQYGVYDVHIAPKDGWTYPEQFKTPAAAQLWYVAPLTSDQLTIANATAGYTGQPITAFIPALANAGVPYTVYYEGTNGTSYTKSSAAPSAQGTYAVTVDAAAYTDTANFDTCWDTAAGVSAGTLTITTSGARVTLDGTVQTDGFSLQSGGTTYAMKDGLIDLSHLTNGAAYEINWTKDGKTAKVWSGTYDGSGSIDLHFKTVSVYAATDGVPMNTDPFGYTEAAISPYANVSPYRSLLQYLVPVTGHLSDVVTGNPTVHTGKTDTAALTFTGWTKADGTAVTLTDATADTAAIVAAYAPMASTAASAALGLTSGETYYFYDKEKKLSASTSSNLQYGNLLGGSTFVPMIYGGTYRLDTYGFDSSKAPDWSAGSSGLVNRFIGADVYEKSAAYLYQYVIYDEIYNTGTSSNVQYNPLLGLRSGSGILLGDTATLSLPTVGRDASAGSGVLSGSGITAAVNPWNDRTQLSILLGSKAAATSANGEAARETDAPYNKFEYTASGTAPYIVSLGTDGTLTEKPYPGTDVVHVGGHTNLNCYNPTSGDLMGVRLVGDMTDAQMANSVIVTLHFGALTTNGAPESLRLILPKNSDGTYTPPAMSDLSGYVTGAIGWTAADGSYYLADQTVAVSDVSLTATANPKPLTAADCTAAGIAGTYVGYYGISNAADYQNLMLAMKDYEKDNATGISNSANVVVLNDVNLAGVTATLPAAYCGIFDGNGKTLSNLSTVLLPKLSGTAEKPAAVKNLTTDGAAAALVGNVAGTASITGITVKNCTTTTACLAADISNNARLTVEDCQVSGKAVYPDAQQYRAGLVLNYNGNSCTVDFRRCAVEFDGGAHANLVGILYMEGTNWLKSQTITAENCSASAVSGALISTMDYSRSKITGTVVSCVIYAASGSSVVITNCDPANVTTTNCFIYKGYTDAKERAWQLNHGGSDASTASSGLWTIKDELAVLRQFIPNGQPSCRVTFTPAADTTYTETYGYTDYTGKIIAMPTADMAGKSLTYQSGGQTLAYTADTVLTADTTVTVTAAAGAETSATPLFVSDGLGASSSPIILSYGQATLDFAEGYIPPAGTILYLSQNFYTYNKLIGSVTLGAGARSVTFPLTYESSNFLVQALEPGKSLSESVRVSISYKPAPTYGNWPSDSKISTTWNNTTGFPNWPTLNTAIVWKDHNGVVIPADKITYTSTDPTIVSVDEHTGVATAVAPPPAMPVYITAKVAETDTTKADSKTYSVNLSVAAIGADWITTASPQFLLPVNGTVSLIAPQLNEKAPAGLTPRITYHYSGEIGYTPKTYDEICSSLAGQSIGQSYELAYSFVIPGYQSKEDGTFTVVRPTVTPTAGTLNVKSGSVYGDTWSSILQLDSTKTTLTLSGGSYTKDITGGTYRVQVKDSQGNFTDMDGAAIPNAGIKSYRLLFTGGGYTDLVAQNGSVTVSQRVAQVQWGNTALPYTGQLQAPAATVTNKASQADDVNISTTGKMRDIGTGYTATASLTGAQASNYTLTGAANLTTPFSIVAGSSDISSTLKVLANGVESSTFTYGQPITVEFSPRAAGSTAMPGDISGGATLMDSSGNVLATASTPVNGKYTLTYRTENKGLTLGTQTLTVTYGGNTAISGGSAAASITLKQKPVIAAGITGVSRPYEPGSTTVQLNTGAVTFGGRVGTDDLRVTLTGSTGTVAAPDAGTGKAVTIPGVTLGGNDAGWYTFFGSSAVTVDITPKEVTAPAITLPQTSYVYTGSAIVPDVVVRDGQTVIPAGEYTVTGENNTAAGSATLRITDKDGGNYTVSGTAGFTITKVNTTLTLAAPAAATYGDTVTLTATVPATAGGSVTFQNGGAVLGTANISGGTATLSYATDGKGLAIGSNTVTASYAGDDNNTSASGTAAVTLAQADPAIGAVTYTGGDLYDSVPASAVSLTRANTAVPGTLTISGVSGLTAGTNTYDWTFTPTDAVNYQTLTGTISLTVAADTLQSISVGTTAPGKTVYTYGETFATDGLTVTASYLSGQTVDVTAQVTSGTLHGGDTSVALSYTSGGVTQTCTVSGLTVNKQPLSVSGMSWSDGSFTYDGTEHGLTLIGTLPQGVTVTTASDKATKAGGYTASAAFALAEGYAAGDYEITGTNPLTKDWSIVPATVPGAKNPGLTLHYTNTKAQTLTPADFGITMKGSFTANSAVTDSGSVLSAAPTYGESVQYALRSGLSFSGQKVTIPVTFTPADTNYAPAALNAVVTLTDKNTVTLTLSADKTGVTYGQSVTYTATLDKDHLFLNALDKLDGEVRFYLGDPANGGTLLAAKAVSGSGASASVTLDFDKLTAGGHTLTAVYGGNANFTDAGAAASTTVAQKALTWDVSGLWASKTADGNADAVINGALRVSGALEGTDPGFTHSGLTGVYDSAVSGQRTVTVTVADAALANGNYVLPGAKPSFAGTITAVTELPGAPASSDGKTYRLEQETGISTVPEALAGNEQLNTPAKIDAQMRVSVTDQSSGIPTANIDVFDITLQFSTDGGKTWQNATANNFPSEGITIVLPYPAGTDKSGYNFVITHMFTVGSKAGTTENVAYEKTADGLKFTLHSLSPVAVGYKALPDFTITASAGAGGSFDTAAAVTVKSGESARFNIKPDAGYAIEDVRVDGQSVGAVESYVFADVTSDHTITATFRSSGSPQTGDRSMAPMTALSIAAVSGLLAAGFVLRTRRRRAK